MAASSSDDDARLRVTTGGKMRLYVSRALEQLQVRPKLVALDADGPLGSLVRLTSFFFPSSCRQHP